MNFGGIVTWQISGHVGGVYQSHYCASVDAFLFSFVYFLFVLKSNKVKVVFMNDFHLCTLESA